jgi:hypothetical protein
VAAKLHPQWRGVRYGAAPALTLAAAVVGNRFVPYSCCQHHAVAGFAVQLTPSPQPGGCQNRRRWACNVTVTPQLGSQGGLVVSPCLAACMRQDMNHHAQIGGDAQQYSNLPFIMIVISIIRPTQYITHSVYANGAIHTTAHDRGQAVSGMWHVVSLAVSVELVACRRAQPYKSVSVFGYRRRILAVIGLAGCLSLSSRPHPGIDTRADAGDLRHAASSQPGGAQRARCEGIAELT